MAANTFTGIGDGQAKIPASEGIGTAAKPKPARTKPVLPDTGKAAPKVSRQDLAEILAQACHDYAKHGGAVKVGTSNAGVVIVLADDFYCRRHARITVASTTCQYCQDLAWDIPKAA